MTFGRDLYLWLGVVAGAFAAFFTVKQMGRDEAQQERALQDAEATIEINETLTEMREQEHDIAEQAQDAGREPRPTDVSELSDDAYYHTFGKRRGTGQV